MKVHIDRSMCSGCSLCWSDCPQVFEEDPGDSLSSIVAGYRVGGDRAEGEAPETLRPACQSAADGCPSSAIAVE